MKYKLELKFHNKTYRTVLSNWFVRILGIVIWSLTYMDYTSIIINKEE